MIQDSHQASPPPTPTAVMGEQVIPMGVVTSWTTTPRVARRVEAATLLAAWTDWQHWIAPVEQDPDVLDWPPFGVGLATARIARAERARMLANMVSVELRGL